MYQPKHLIECYEQMAVIAQTKSWLIIKIATFTVGCCRVP